MQRSLATVIDAFCFAYLIYFGLASFSFVSHSGFAYSGLWDGLFQWLFFLAPIALIIFLYHKHQNSPGRQFMRLELIVPGKKSLFQRHLFVRNLIKWSSLLISWQVSLVFLESNNVDNALHALHWNGVLSFCWQYNFLLHLMLPLIIWGVLNSPFLLPLSFSPKGVLAHDYLSGSHYKTLKSTSLQVYLRGASSVIVICLLVLIILPNFIFSGCGGSKTSSVKANMHTFQTMVETYGVDHAGIYPPNVEALKFSATDTSTENGTYWKDFTNPFSSNSGLGASYDNAHFQRSPGMILYQPLPDKTGAISSYLIHGVGKEANIFVKDKGQDFVLTNN